MKNRETPAISRLRRAVGCAIITFVMNTTLSRELVTRGISPTPQRLAVYGAVAGRRDHPSVETVHRGLRRRLPTLSKTTVYATLQLLAEKRLIGCVHGEGDEVRYDGSPAFHAHFRCRACGKIYDVMPEGAHERPFVRVPKGFQIDNEELTYYGICSSCGKKKKGKGK